MWLRADTYQKETLAMLDALYTTITNQGELILQLTRTIENLPNSEDSIADLARRVHNLTNAVESYEPAVSFSVPLVNPPPLPASQQRKAEGLHPCCPPSTPKILCRRR